MKSGASRKNSGENGAGQNGMKSGENEARNIRMKNGANGAEEMGLGKWDWAKWDEEWGN